MILINKILKNFNMLIKYLNNCICARTNFKIIISSSGIVRITILETLLAIEEQIYSYKADENQFPVITSSSFNLWLHFPYEHLYILKILESNETSIYELSKLYVYL